MAYPLSATKLVSYRQCPQAYYFKHERGLKSPASFGSAALGIALHRALAKIYGDWNYAQPVPGLDWLDQCWQNSCEGLTLEQVGEGHQILHRYYERYIAPVPMLRQPLGIEGKVQAVHTIANVEFSLNGRYDRLDYVDDGLELIDYKTNKVASIPDSLDLQLGLYYLILEKTYHCALKRLKLIFLRAGQEQVFSVTPEHHERVLTLISELALKLRADDQWEPAIGHHCKRCSFLRYCPAHSEQPEPLPSEAKRPRQVQLTLAL